ncbi:MAG: hypothetical protein ABIW84_03185 [Ilumatobacteraceae bacterium]
MAEIRVARTTDLSADCVAEIRALLVDAFAGEFSERVGWERWRGPTFVRRDDILVRTADEDDGIMVLRYGAMAECRLTLAISCAARAGDDW